MKVESPFLVVCFESAHWINGHYGGEWHVRDEPTVGPPELKRAVLVSIDLVSLLVDSEH